MEATPQQPAEPAPRSLLGSVLITITVIALVASAIDPFDRLTWVLEALPTLIGLVFVVALRKRFPLTTLLWILLTVHGLILVLGGAYSYARVPLGDWISSIFGWERNCYDRIGHLAQGFVPAILAREVLLRTSPLGTGKWLFVLASSVCLAFSAFYELIEWWAALALGQGADEFLGTQGDQWDTQWDMFLALIGSIASQVLLARMHKRQLIRRGMLEFPTSPDLSDSR